MRSRRPPYIVPTSSRTPASANSTRTFSGQRRTIIVARFSPLATAPPASSVHRRCGGTAPVARFACAGSPARLSDEPHLLRRRAGGVWRSFEPNASSVPYVPPHARGVQQVWLSAQPQARTPCGLSTAKQSAESSRWPRDLPRVGPRPIVEPGSTPIPSTRSCRGRRRER
jgi:hypothetical protein